MNNPYNQSFNNYVFNLERNIYISNVKINELYHINNNLRYNYDKLQFETKELNNANKKQNELIDNYHKKYLLLNKKYNELKIRLDNLEKKNNRNNINNDGSKYFKFAVDNIIKNKKEFIIKEDDYDDEEEDDEESVSKEKKDNKQKDKQKENKDNKKDKQKDNKKTKKMKKMKKMKKTMIFLNL